MQYWLMKSEPDVWSIDQQKKAGKKGVTWDGVRNYQAANNLKKMEVGDLSNKLKSFGWEVNEINGHNMKEIIESIKWAEIDNGRPKAILANTIKGNGVSFMENNPSFHGMAPNDEQLKIAMEELS